MTYLVLVLTQVTPNHSGDTSSRSSSKCLELRLFLAIQALPPRRKTRLKSWAPSLSLSSRLRTDPSNRLWTCLWFKPCRQYTSQRAMWSFCYSNPAAQGVWPRHDSRQGHERMCLQCRFSTCANFPKVTPDGDVPPNWRDANISPVLKKGSPDDPANYRLISLTSIDSKLLEHIVHKAVMDHLDHLHLLSNVQHGFRKERSCETQLSAVIKDIAYSLGLSQQVDAIILDFSKAFDTVPHHRLLYKLDQ